MADETNNLVIGHLRHIRARVDGLSTDMGQVIPWLGAIERHVAGLHISDVDQNADLDRIEARLDRSERRLELTD
jgi:hypothetical protein